MFAHAQIFHRLKRPLEAAPVGGALPRSPGWFPCVYPTFPALHPPALLSCSGRLAASPQHGDAASSHQSKMQARFDPKQPALHTSQSGFFWLSSLIVQVIPAPQTRQRYVVQATAPSSKLPPLIIRCGCLLLLIDLCVPPSEGTIAKEATSICRPTFLWKSHCGFTSSIFDR